jgi:hypothetical protein
MGGEPPTARLMREFTLKERLLPMWNCRDSGIFRRSHRSLAVRPSSPFTLKYGATRSFVVGLGRAFSSIARTHSSCRLRTTRVADAGTSCGSTSEYRRRSNGRTSFGTPPASTTRRLPPCGQAHSPGGPLLECVTRLKFRSDANVDYCQTGPFEALESVRFCACVNRTIVRRVLFGEPKTLSEYLCFKQNACEVQSPEPNCE